MRKLLLLSFLLAGAAAPPALADPGDHNDRAERQAERAERQAERSETRSENRSERPHFNGGSQPQVVQQNVQPPQQNTQQNTQTDMARTQEIRAERAGRDNAGSEDGGRGFRMHGRRQDTAMPEGTLRQSENELPQVMQPRHRSPIVSDVPREGTQPPLRVENHHRSQQPHWSTAWRNDHRYDWHHWRNHHRSWFHVGFYIDPFGWGYQPYSIGWRLWPSYYGNNYWINDPYQYRLPYAPPGTQWIRYYNDALLVDMYTGEVVDVIYNFFW